jgi:hypothetical protein
MVGHAEQCSDDHRQIARERVVSQDLAVSNVRESRASALECLTPWSTPPSHTQGNAVSARAMGYQSGPRSATVIAVIAPAEPATKPTIPTADAPFDVAP